MNPISQGWGFLYSRKNKLTIHITNNLGDIYYYEIYFRRGITKGKTTYVVRRNGAK